MHFYQYSYENFIKKCPTNSVFLPNARNFNVWFINFFENMLK